jgi:two-component system, LytTR family, sensor histidine kinase AlgZ
MSVGQGFRRLCTTERAYWLRVAAVSLTTAVVLTALFVASGQSSSIALTLRHALVHSLIMAGLAATSVPWLRRRLEPLGATAQWAVTLPFVLALAAVGSSLACGVIVGVDPGHHASFWECFRPALPINAVITLTICTAMTLYESQRRRLAAVTLELRTRELERERDRKMALQARLASLESRLQPHFLFNTLNAISALIQEDPDQAERTVERLAALLRFSLDAAERGLVPLAHELKIVADYLEIEHTRLGERLAWRVDVTPEAVACEVPPLAVETLVENSVKHAIAPRPSGGSVRVEGSIAGERLVLSVWDDGPGFTDAALAPGHGLDSLRQRLAARFGGDAALTIGRRAGGTLVTLSLPATVPVR